MIICGIYDMIILNYVFYNQVRIEVVVGKVYLAPSFTLLDSQAVKLVIKRAIMLHPKRFFFMCSCL